MSHASSSSRAPRVLFVDVSSRRGGAEASLDELLASLAARGVFSMTLATARVDAAPDCPVFPIPPVRLHRPSRLFAFLRSVAALIRARRALAQVIRDFQPDIVHANGIAAVFAIPHTRARILWHVRDWPRRPYAALAARRCETVVAISRPVEETLRRVLPASLHGRIRLVENGIDFGNGERGMGNGEKGTDRQTVKLSNRQIDHANGRAVGMIAHLVPWKRHDLFVEAAILLRDFRDAEGRPITWIIAGSDLFGEHADYVAALRKRIVDAGLAERFVWLEGRSAAEILPGLDLLVHPTDQEPFGRVICEAMAAGVPIVACDAAGPGSILEDGQTGFLFLPGGPRLSGPQSLATDLAERIRFALTHPNECASVAKAAKTVARERHSIDRVADEIASFLAPQDHLDSTGAEC